MNQQPKVVILKTTRAAFFRRAWGTMREWLRKDGAYMPRTIGIGYQNFEQLITNDNFYVDKTMFISEWWEKDY